MSKLLDVHPVLPVRDVARATSFYIDRLGFQLLFCDDPGAPQYAGVGRDGVIIHLQWHDPAEWERVERPMLRFVVDDVDALFKTWRHADVYHENTALRDTEWGTREFAFYDLDRNGLTFMVDR